MEIILASASPRRKELLEQIGIKFKIRVSDTEEKADTRVPHLLVQELSRQKAEAVLEAAWNEIWNESWNESWNEILQEGSEGEELLVIGADTVVACGGRILGKPGSAGEAVEMLSLLQGQVHEVYTGVTLLYRVWEDFGKRTALTRSKSFYEATKVHFYPMDREEIAAYAATGDPLDKAGAYGIQGLCARYISGIEGDYNNVVGLPVGRLYQEMKHWLLCSAP